MVTYRKVPARIIIVDHVGIPNHDEMRFRRRADQELTKLEQMVERGDLDQGYRQVEVEPGVTIDCAVVYTIREATVTVGKKGGERLMEDPCYCCSPGFAAGIVMATYHEDLDEDDLPIFEKDEHFFADIVLCQAPSNDMPVKISLEEEVSIGGSVQRRTRVLYSKQHGAEQLTKVPFANHQTQLEGDSVLVLITPIWDFKTYPGVYMSCINKRQVAQEVFLHPWPTISTAYINSSGVSCKIVEDFQMWDEDYEYEEPPVPDPDWKYYPFRILPIKIDSCLTS